MIEDRKKPREEKREEEKKGEAKGGGNRVTTEAHKQRIDTSTES